MRRNNNSKEHVKLYKSKKNWVAATIFTTALGITGLAATESVSANSVNASSVNSSSTSQVSSSSVKPSNSVSLRSSSQSSVKKISTSSATSQNNNNFATQASSTQADKNAQAKASLQNQINQKQDQLKQQESQQSQVQNQYNQDQQAVKQAVADQASKVAAVNETANEQKQSAQQTVNDLQNQETSQVKQDLQNQVSQKQNDLQNVNNQINNTQSDLTNTQNQLSSLNNKSQFGYNDSEGVVENVAHMDHNSHDYQRMFGPMYTTNGDNSNFDMSNPLLTNVFNKGFSPNLEQHDLINNNQLTSAQAKETCEALMAQLNATREAKGLQPFVMTDQMFNAVMERASQQSADYQQHNESDIDQALNDNGIASNDWRSENLAYADHASNVAQLIITSQASISEMLNDDADSNWGHRHDFLANYGNPVQASFGLYWDGNRYVLAFDVANYNGNGSDNLMNQVTDWENQSGTTDNSSQISALQSKINNLQSQLSNLQDQKRDLQNQIINLQNQANNVSFDESELSFDDQQKYNDAQNTLNTINQWRQNQLDQINNAANSQNEALYNKTVAEKNELDSLNNQIAQTKADIANLQSQLDNLNKPTQSVATKPADTSKPTQSVATKPADTSKPTQSVATKPADTSKPTQSVATKPADTSKPAQTVETKPADTSKPTQSVATKPVDTNKSTQSVATKPAENKPVESPVVSNDKKDDDVLPGPDQIKVTPVISSENDKSSSNDANKVVANISYNKGIDPLTNRLLSDETPAQQRKAKNYIENLNKTVAVKENKSSEPVYNQPITFTFSESKVKADNVKGNSAAKNELPTTGENEDKAATALGIEAVSMGLALGGLSFLKRKKKY